jgi:AraC-like DNA-binding protein
MELRQSVVVYLFGAIQAVAAIALLAAAARCDRRLVCAAAFFAVALVGPGIGDWLEIESGIPIWIVAMMQCSLLMIGPSLRYLAATLAARDEEGCQARNAASHLAFALASIALLVAGVVASQETARIVAAIAMPLCLTQTAFYIIAALVDLARRAKNYDDEARAFLTKIYVATAAAWIIWVLSLVFRESAFLIVLDRLSLAAIAVLAMFWGAANAMRARFREAHPYEKSGLGDRAATELAQRIVESLEGEGLFADPDLDLRSLAEHLDVDPRKLSQAFGQILGTSFSRYLSELRLSRFRELAADRRLADRSILDLALEAGFGSKSRFNQIFRDRYGETPSRYRARTAT